jgi:hypothetical protein
LANTARVTLAHVEADNWDEIFGKIHEDGKEVRIASLERIAAAITTREKPWCRGQ